MRRRFRDKASTNGEYEHEHKILTAGLVPGIDRNYPADNYGFN